MPIQIHQAKGFSKLDNDYIKNLPTDNFEKEMAYETLPTTIEDLLRASDSKLKIEPDIDSIYGTASTLTAILDSMTNLKCLSISRKMSANPTAKTKITVEFQHSQGTVNEGKSFYGNLGYMQSVTFATAINNGFIFTITAHLIDSKNTLNAPCSIRKEYSSVMFLAMNLTRLLFLNVISTEDILECYEYYDETDDPILPQIMIHMQQMIKKKELMDRTGISCRWMANGVIFGNFKKSQHIHAYLNCNTQLEALAFSTVFDCFIQIMKLGVFKKKEFLRKRKYQLFTQDDFLKHDSSILRDQNTDLQTHMNYVGDRLIFHVANAGMKLKVTPIEVNRALENNADAAEEDNDTDYTEEDNTDADRVDTMFEENRQGLSVLLNDFVCVQALADHKSLSMFVDNGYEFQWDGNFEYCLVAPLGRPKRKTVTNRTNNSDDIDAKSDDSDDDSDAAESDAIDDESSGVASSGDENDSITNGGSDSDNVDTALNPNVIPDPIKLFPGQKSQYRNQCNHPLLASNSSGPIRCKWDPLLKKLTPVKEYNAVVGMQEYVSGLREAALYYRSELGPLLHLPSILKNKFAFMTENINEGKELTKCMELLKTIDEFRTIMDLGNERSFPLRIEMYYYIGLEEASYFNEGEEEEILSAFSESLFNVTRTPLFSLQLAISPKMPLMYCWYQSLEKARQLILRNIKPVHLRDTGKQTSIFVVNLQCSRELQASLVFASELLANGLGVREGYSQPLQIMAQIMNKIPTTSPLLFPEHRIRGVTVDFKYDVVDPVMEAEAPSSQMEAEAPSSPIRFGICASYLAISGESEELISNIIEMEESSAADSRLEGCPWIASVAIISKKLRAGARAGPYKKYSKLVIRKYYATGLKFTLHAIQSHARTYFTSEVGDKCDDNEKDKYLSRIITTFARVYLVAYFHQIKWDMMNRFVTLGVSKDRYCNLFRGPEKLPPIHLTDYMGDTDLFCKRKIESQNSDCDTLIQQMLAGSHKTREPHCSWNNCLHRDIYLSIEAIFAALKVGAGEQYQWYFEETYLQGKICMEYLSMCPKNAQLIAYVSLPSCRNMHKYCKGRKTAYSLMDKDQLSIAAAKATQSKNSMQSSQRRSARQHTKLKVNDSIMPLDLPMHVIAHITKMKWIKWRKSQKKWKSFNPRQWICLLIQFHSLPRKPSKTVTFEKRLAKCLTRAHAIHLYKLYNGRIAIPEVKVESPLCLAHKDMLLNILESQMIRLFDSESKYGESVKNMSNTMKKIFKNEPQVAKLILSSLQAFRIVEENEYQLTISSHDKVWIKGQSIAFFEKYVSKISPEEKLTIKDLNSIAQATLSEIESETPYTMETQQSQYVPGAAEQTAFDSDDDERFEVMEMDTQQSQDGHEFDAGIERDTGEERVDAVQVDTQQSQDGHEFDADIECGTGEERVDAVQDFEAIQKWCNIAMGTTFSISANSPEMSLAPDPKDDDTVLYAMKMLQKKLDSIIGKTKSAHENDIAWLTSIGSTLGAQHTRITDDDVDPNVTMDLACKTFEGFINKIDYDDREIQQRKKRPKL